MASRMILEPGLPPKGKTLVVVLVERSLLIAGSQSPLPLGPNGEGRLIGVLALMNPFDEAYPTS